jgi:hypothetical protein
MSIIFIPHGTRQIRRHKSTPKEDDGKVSLTIYPPTLFGWCKIDRNLDLLETLINKKMPQFLEGKAGAKSL